MIEPEELMTPAEVSALARVDPKTVTRWARAGKLTCIFTLGGHRRYRASEVREKLGLTQPAIPGPGQPTRDDVMDMLREGATVDRIIEVARAVRP